MFHHVWERRGASDLEAKVQKYLLLPLLLAQAEPCRERFKLSQKFETVLELSKR